MGWYAGFTVQPDAQNRLVAASHGGHEVPIPVAQGKQPDLQCLANEIQAGLLFVPRRRGFRGGRYS